MSLRDLSRYRLQGKGEQAVREEWIFPLLLHLGYGPATLNEVRFEESLKLRQPVRMIGSTRFKVDYLPTVLGHRLWLIEAKAPGAADPVEHLGQAWSYATHPEVNVPLMVLADGAHLAVHDLTMVNWETPVLDLPSTELEDRFEEVLDLLGARTVARSMRRRIFDYLQLALNSELDLDALKYTLSQTAKIVEIARPQILENRRQILADADQGRAADDNQLLQTAGLWGLAQEMNVPFGWSWGDVDRGLNALKLRPTETELNALWLAVSDRDGNERATWGLRTFRLSVVLQARSIDGCADIAERRSRDTVREHLLGFPDDSAAAAAHRLEVPLFVLALRLVTEPNVGLRSRVMRQLEQLDAEAALRLGPASRIHGWALSTSLLICRRFLTSSPWNREALEERTVAVRRLIESLSYDEQFVSQYIGFDVGVNWDRDDPLVDYTLISLAKFGQDFSLTAEEQTVIEAHTGRAGSVGDSARQLLNLA